MTRQRSTVVFAALGLTALLAMPTTVSANLLVNPSLEETFVDEWGNTVPTGWGLWMSSWEGWGASWITPHLGDGTAYGAGGYVDQKLLRAGILLAIAIIVPSLAT